MSLAAADAAPDIAAEPKNEWWRARPNPDTQRRLQEATPHQFSAALMSDGWRARPDSLAVVLSGGQYTPAPHLRLIGWLLWLQGIHVIRRLIVNLSPGMAKSSTVSQWFPVWLLERNPTERIIDVSYEATLAEEWGKAARRIIEEHGDVLGVTLWQGSQAANRWRTTRGGGMWTAGINGAVTGRRASRLLVDDPHKNLEQANSLAMRKAVWDFYVATGRTRLLPGATTGVLQTRWHEDDLTGRLIKADESGAEDWVICRLPAIAEGDEDLAAVIGERTVDRLTKMGLPLFDWKRKNGEALWPFLEDFVTGEKLPWYDLDELLPIKQLSPYIWNGLYQQHPSAPEGEQFPVHLWKRVDVAPRGLRLVRWWDLAATAGGGDETVGALVGIDDQGFVYVIDLAKGRLAGHEVETLMRTTAQADHAAWRGRVRTIVEQEPGASGKQLSERLVRVVLSGFRAEHKPATGDKEVRAYGFSAQQQAGNVFLVRKQSEGGVFIDPDWHGELVEQSRAFPNAAFDDMVDACSSAFNALALAPKRKVRTSSAAGRQLPGGR